MENRVSLPKWPFYLGEVLLVCFALIIYFHGSVIFGTYAIWASVFAVGLGAFLFVIPFILEHKGNIELEKKALEQASGAESGRLEYILNEMMEVNDSFASQANINEKQVLILESLLKRMEARLRILDQSLLTPEEEGKNEEVLIDFDKAREPEVAADDEDLDIEFELEDDEEPANGEESSIIVHSLIGIGSKPYIRGEGDGLSWDEGVPMEFIEIGKWEWVSSKIEDPIIFQIYKDDKIAAKGDPMRLEPGDSREVTPIFED